MAKRANKEFIDALWSEYSRTRSVEIRNKIIEHYGPVVNIHAARLALKLPSVITFDEICSAGFDGLIEAVENYDPTRNTKFETFCQNRIRGAVIDWLRESDEQSRTVRAFEKDRNHALNTSNNESGEIREDELAEKMGVSIDRYEKLSRLSKSGTHYSFQGFKYEDGNRIDPEDTRVPQPYAAIQRRMMVDYIKNGLNREERLTLVLYYCENLTMKEIGQVLDLSESRISQIHRDLMKRLRKKFNPSNLEDKI